MMKRFAVLVLACALFVGVPSAMAETMWGVSGRRYLPTPAYLFEFDSATGQVSPGKVYDLSGPLSAANIYGLAVAGDVAFVSYFNGVISERMLAAVSTIDGAVLSSTATGGLRFTGLSWDGTNLYGQQPYDEYVSIIGLDGVTFNGVTQGASLGTGYGGATENTFWTALPGFNPASGQYYSFLAPQSYQKGDDFDAGTTLVYSGRGNELDQPGAMAFTSDGVLLASRWDGGLQIWTDNPDAATSWSSMYAIDFTGTVGENGATDIGGLSRVGPALAPPVPEPMTMAAVGMALAGLGGYIRRRRTA